MTRAGISYLCHFSLGLLLNSWPFDQKPNSLIHLLICRNIYLCKVLFLWTVLFVLPWLRWSNHHEVSGVAQANLPPHTEGHIMVGQRPVWDILKGCQILNLKNYVRGAFKSDIEIKMERDTYESDCIPLLLRNVFGSCHRGPFVGIRRDEVGNPIPSHLDCPLLWEAFRSILSPDVHLTPSLLYWPWNK